MIWLEAVAAALVGLALLLVVLGPLISREPVPAIVDDEPEDLEETPKGIALSALKEIEFDQATGKLSDEDYAMLKGKYTAQALQALRAEDGHARRGERRAGIEAVIAARAVAIRAEGAIRARRVRTVGRDRSRTRCSAPPAAPGWAREPANIAGDTAPGQPVLRPLREARRGLTHGDSGVWAPATAGARLRQAGGTGSARCALARTAACLPGVPPTSVDTVHGAIVHERNGAGSHATPSSAAPRDAAAAMLRIGDRDLVAGAAEASR